MEMSSLDSDSIGLGRNTGIVDQDVELAMTVGHLGKSAIDGIRIGYIGRDTDRGTTELLL